ncbi:helix-turn-helix transcriptional regulator [Nocardiopsis sp. MG754419]|uniref:ArsR/SmtB family transcription factor n=1 Tax=Nocardiopsis sp. MG754419 TaxID=2259865 RepID=UPI001BA788E9|nr:helix-turn-helix domain-containing protein [Nocardiopsis sp. MG754419]MBR8744736.1 transcriptional regulator [Nocardiopsis sp. MG754419]
MNEEPESTRPLNIDADALRGLAHPLRARILDVLRSHGPATATILGRTLGESSGSTSYHLRQLARFGFVDADPGHSGRRDRWWRIRPGGWRLSGSEHLRDPATREAAEIVLGRYYTGRRERLDRWHALSRERSDEPRVRRWQTAMQDSVSQARMTPEETEEFAGELVEFIRSWTRRYEERTAQTHPETEMVELQTDLFPHLAEATGGSGETPAEGSVTASGTEPDAGPGTGSNGP